MCLNKIIKITCMSLCQIWSVPGSPSGGNHQRYKQLDVALASVAMGRYM